MTLRRLILRQLANTPGQSAEQLGLLNPRVQITYVKNMLLLMKEAKQVYVESYIPPPSRGRHTPVYSLYYPGCVSANHPGTLRKPRQEGPPKPRATPAPPPSPRVCVLLGGIPWLPGL
jgi:hypothetical protein